MNWLRPLSATVQEPLENLAIDKRALVEVQVCGREVPACCWSKPNTSLGALERVIRKNFDLTCVTPFFKVAQFSARRDFLALDLFCREK